MSYLHGPIVVLMAPGVVPWEDVYEVRMVGENCVLGTRLDEHPPGRIKTIRTYHGMMHVCERCSSVWLIHHKVPST